MTWHLTPDIEEFELAAKEFLLTDPVGNTVLLTVAATLARNGVEAYGGDPAQFGWYQGEDGAVRGAFVRTPPRPVLISTVPAAAVEPLLTIEGIGGAVSGPAAEVTALAEAWVAASGRGSTLGMRRRLYRLAELTPPSPMPDGYARLATPADRDLLIDWFEAFSGDIGQPGGIQPSRIDDRIQDGLLLLWEVDGVPVAMAAATPPVGGTARIAPVYTPRALRGRGYAGAVTAELSRRIRDAGHEVLLFTDLDNPTSNALYQRIGYRPLGDYLDVELER
ncbi:MAG: GNAT family N-acetyltransferase [Catenulispora sp.]|nr:GNAT family N-acetyltransferase [Catenulispora sp.]